MKTSYCAKFGGYKVFRIASLKARDLRISYEWVKLQLVLNEFHGKKRKLLSLQNGCKVLKIEKTSTALRQLPIENVRIKHVIQNLFPLYNELLSIELSFQSLT